MKKVVDTREYVSVLRELVLQGRDVSMRVAGNSMSPFLVHERDDICFKMPWRKLRRGDMAFYQRENGQFIMHRVYRVTPKGLYFVGDAQMQIEGPLPEERVFALVYKVRRKGRWVGPEDFWWKFFEKVWIRMVPFRGIACKLYGVWKRGTAS